VSGASASPGAAPPAALADGWRPRDCHAHTTFSDGALAPAALVAAVRAHGTRPSVADHLSRDVTSAVKSPLAVAAYLDALETLRADVPDLGIAGEFCWHDALWRELDATTWGRFTHTVGSLHAIALADGTPMHMFSRRWPEGLTADAYMDAHVAALERFAREMPVDVLAHPTLLPIPLRSRPPEELWTEEREERAVEALFAGGIAFELSNRYRVHERFARRAAGRGVRLSLGSDGHGLDQVADVAWPLALARGIGVDDAALYDPGAHGSRTGAYA
jgi:histidinol phosphatase-like PHP family hydrolase